MRVLSIYIFLMQSLRKHLKKGLLFFGLYLSIVLAGYAQQYTYRDQAEIKYQAQLTLIEYENILNLISNSAIPEAVLEEAVVSTYNDPSTKIFYAQDVPVEDNIAPSRLDSANMAAITVKEYINDFNEQYVKSDLETVDFSDFEISNLKQEGGNLFIYVKYTSNFKGRHKEDPAAYKPVARVAKLRVAKKGGNWVTYIAAISAHDPAFSITAAKGDVELDDAVTDDGTFAAKLDELISAQEAQAQQTDDVAIAQSWRAFDNKRFEAIRAMGEEAQKDREYEKARQLYTQALRIRPKEATVEASLVKLNKTIQQKEQLAKKFESGEYVAAIQAYSEAIAGDPKDADLYLGRGKCYEQLNELQTALRDFSTAIELDPDFAEALSNRAKLYVRTEQPQLALKDYTRIIESLEDASAYYPERAKLKVSLGDIKGALEDYTAAIAQNPEVAVLHYEKGLIEYQQNQQEAAIASFTAAIEKDSLLADAYYARGLAHADLENISAAAVDFEKARKAGLNSEQLAAVDKTAINYAALGAEAMNKADYKQALEHYIKVVLLSPANESAWVAKGDAHYKLQDYGNALQSYSKAIALEKPSLAYYNRGLVYRQLRDFAGAKKDFEQFVPVGWQLISQAESKVGNGQSAESLEQIAQEVTEGWYRLGFAQLMAEQYADALTSLDKALDINKNYPEALYARGAAQLGLNNYKKAIKDIEKSLKSGIEDSPWVYLTLGDAYQALGQTDYAISIYTYIIDSVDKDFDQAYLHRADSYKRIKQYQLALQDIKLAISLNNKLSKDVNLITNKGMLELYESKFQEADLSFDQALSIEENDAWALYGKASVLASQNKMEESLDLYRKAFQTGKIEWSAIKDDPIIKHVSKQKAFKELVDASLRL